MKKLLQAGCLQLVVSNALQVNTGKRRAHTPDHEQADTSSRALTFGAVHAMPCYQSSDATSLAVIVMPTVAAQTKHNVLADPIACFNVRSLQYPNRKPAVMTS